MELQPYDGKALVDPAKLAEQHFSLVGELKRALAQGQAHFLSAGKYLNDIKDNKTYSAEDSSQDVTFAGFCSRPDIPLPGSTDDSRVRMAYTLINVYKTFKVKFNVPDSELVQIGWTKLDLLAKEFVKNPTANLADLMSKGKELTVKDLALELKSPDSMADRMNCQHEIEIIHRCKKCKTITQRL